MTKIFGFGRGFFKMSFRPHSVSRAEKCRAGDDGRVNSNELAAIRTLVDPMSPDDAKVVHGL
jgi:hypothetical protein